MAHVLMEEQARTRDAASRLTVGVKRDTQDPVASVSGSSISAEGREENTQILFSARSYECAIQL